jgi:hypothetical protein
MTVYLIPMLQPRLHDTLAATHLIEEPMHVGNELLVDVGEVGRDDGSEQQPAEPGCGIDWQDEVAE